MPQIDLNAPHIIGEVKLLRTAEGGRSSALLAPHFREGTTIVQVTHSEANAAYSHRVVNLADGWIVQAGAGREKNISHR